ncbi:hypothetical protein ACF0H5_006100 [Mactra antiquata]
MKYLMILVCLMIFSSVEGDDGTLGIFGNNTISQNATNLLQNAMGAFGQWFQNPNAETVKRVNNLINDLLSFAKDDSDGGIQSGTNTTGSFQDILQVIQRLIPFIATNGQLDPDKILSLGSTVLQGGSVALRSAGVSPECSNDVIQWFNGLQQFHGWAWKIVDAGFKIPSDVAGLNMRWLGSREECLSVLSDGADDVTGNMQQFHGKYCRLLFPLGNIAGAGKQNLLLGTCASHRCTNEDVTTMVTMVSKQIKPDIQIITSCLEDSLELDSGAIVTIVILAILGFMVLLGTLYDVFVVQLSAFNTTPSVVIVKRSNPPPYTDLEKLEGQINEGFAGEKNGLGVEVKGYEESQTSQQVEPVASVIQQQTKPTRGVLENILLSFSVYTNGYKILGANQGSGSIGAVNGIRFLSMAWVILGHTYFFATNFTVNMFDFAGKKLFQKSFMAVIYASVSVDSFFALSGVLVAYLSLRELKKVGGVSKFNWFMFYFHRFWRLTPPYMLVLMIGTTLYKYVFTGAMKVDGDSMYMITCRDNWWINLLYINNYVKTDEGCMGWSWYLANDMQLYIISPLLLVPLFYSKILGGIISGLFIVGAVVTSGLISYHGGYLAQGIPQAGPQPEDFQKHYYVPVWTRFGPYIVGLVTGYILYKTKCQCRIPKVLNIILWVICFGTICAIVYGPYSDGETHIFTETENTVFNAFFRTAWGAAICWIIFACATGHGGWINQVLSWSPFIPLGRLTYCAYLIHPLVMEIYYESKDQPIYFSEFETVYMFLGNMVLSYGAAFVVSLVFESPMMGLEKAIFKKK